LRQNDTSHETTQRVEDQSLKPPVLHLTDTPAVVEEPPDKKVESEVYEQYPYGEEASQFSLVMIAGKAVEPKEAALPMVLPKRLESESIIDPLPVATS